MNDTTEPTTELEIRPGVSSFVDQVRARLGDLTEDERDELLGGLEADLSERVAERGGEQSVTEVLGDPRVYAEELRAAAGFYPSTNVLRQRRPVHVSVASWIDHARARWEHLVLDPRAAPVWAAVVALQPAWWVLRAWVAVQVLDITTGGWEAATVIPTLYGIYTGAAVLLVAIVVSVQVGRKRLWPGTTLESSVMARLVVLGVNIAAVLCMLNVVGGTFPASGGRAIYQRPASAGVYPEGDLMNGRSYVRNVYAYDAEGNPLTGVQLFDQRGRPLNVNPGRSTIYAGPGHVVTYPWTDGGRNRFNVFPLPTRHQLTHGRIRNPGEAENPPALPSPPLSVVPPVALPGERPDVPADEAAGDLADRPRAGRRAGGRAERDGGRASGRQGQDADSEKGASR